MPPRLELDIVGLEIGDDYVLGAGSGMSQLPGALKRRGRLLPIGRSE